MHKVGHKFSYKWSMSEGYPAKGIKKNNLKVFSCFACGGGSTMGFKLSGYDVIGANEFIEDYANCYKVNHNPKFLFVEDIRSFRIKKDLPEEFFHLDILDGSPPCSAFSIAGKREAGWGVAKKYAKGRKVQVVDDLYFEFIALAKRLQPKIIIAENVKGMLMGNAKIYCQKIKDAFVDAGYEVQLFLLNSITMGVPQRRERIFFICRRVDLKLPKLNLVFNEEAIKLAEFLDSKDGKLLPTNGKLYADWLARKKGDRGFEDICSREEGIKKCFGRVLLSKEDYAPTLVSGNTYIYFDDFKEMSDNNLCQIGSYPLDYNFINLSPIELIGRSVPPVMMAQIAHQIYLQWLKND